MPPGQRLSDRVSRSIRRRMATSVENDPDGAMATYLWLWQSIGRRTGLTLIPRSIRFSLIASHDLISLGGWYARSRVLRASKSVIGRASVLALVAWLGLSPPHQASGQDLDDEAVMGSWEGNLDVADGTQLTIVVERGEDGGLTGTLESPDQTVAVVPLSSVTFDDGTLTLVVSSVPGSATFTLTRSEDGTTLRGTFSQGERRIPLELMKKI